MTANTYKGYTVRDDELVTPSGWKLDLRNVHDAANGKRQRMWFGPAHKRVYVYRVVLCVLLGVDSLPKGLDVHHVNCDRHDCRPENLVLMEKTTHRHAHDLADRMTSALVDNGNVEFARSRYIEYVKANAVSIR